MGRSIVRYTAFLCSLFVLASIGGVFATWYYTYETTPSVQENLSVSLSDFEWKPAEILPTESEIGENHLALIELILNENNKGYGLNYDNKHVLEGYLDKYGLVFSNQKVSGGNLKFVSDETKFTICCSPTNDSWLNNVASSSVMVLSFLECNFIQLKPCFIFLLYSVSIASAYPIEPLLRSFAKRMISFAE